MVSDEIDQKLKLLCLEICARELVELNGTLDKDKLMENTNVLYNTVYERGLFVWKSPFKDTQ